MSVRQAFHFVLRKLWLLAAILLVTAAVLLSIARFSLPYLDHYREDIELLISEHYQQDIQIGSLNATWTGSGPALVLEQLQLEQTEELPFTLEVEQVSLILSFWTSVFQRQLVFDDFVLSGLDIEINTASTGTDTDTPLVNALESLLLNQLERFQVQDSMIRIRIADQAERLLHVESLNWLSSNGRKQASGRLRIPGLTANHLNFLIDFQGSRLASMTGNLYVEAERLDISPWVEEIASTATITRAEFNLQGWLDINDGQFGEGQLHLDEQYLSWERQGEPHELVTSSTVWAIKPQEEGWLLNSQPLDISIDGKVWPVERVVWQYLDGEHMMNMRDVELPDITPLWSLFGSPGEEIRSWFEGMQPQGTMTDARLHLNAERDISLYMLAEHMRWQAYKGIPGIDAVQVELWTTSYGGRFRVGGEDVQLNSPTTLTSAQTINTIQWEGFWERASDGWEITIPGAEIGLPDAEIIQDFRLSSYNQQSPVLEWIIQSSRSGMDVFRVASLLPLQMGDRLSAYLNDALQGGDLDSLAMLWRGPLNDFPYQSGEGVFQARAEIRQLDFKFRPEWPALRAEQSVVTFTNDELAIEAWDGSMMDVEVSEALARFPNMLSPQRRIYIDATVAGAGDAVKQLFDNSPLQASVGGTLEQVQPVGLVRGEFSLDIPLFEGGEVRSNGVAYLRNQDIYLSSINTRLTDVSGDFYFENTDIRFESTEASLYGLPISIDVTGARSDADRSQSYEVRAMVNGDWPIASIQEQHPDLPLIEWSEGSFEWQSDFQLALRTEGGFAYQWDMQSDLASVESGLPEPLNKQQGESWQWKTQLRGNEQALTVRSEIPERFRFRGDLNIGDAGFRAVDFQIGPHGTGLASTPETGNRLIFNLEQAIAAEWIPVVQSLYQRFGSESSEDNNESTGFMPGLSLISGSADSVHWLGQDFSDVRMFGEPGEDGWQYSVDADQSRMRIYQRGDGSLAIRGDFLNLESVPTGEGSSVGDAAEREWLDNLPPISFTCQICRYSGRDLGEVSLELVPENEYGQIEQFSVRKGSTTLSFAGGWSHVNGPVSTRIQGRFSSEDIGALMHDFEVNSVVRDSSANVDFDLNWAGYLTDFNIESLSGNVNWRLGSGYLRDVSDGGARLFSVLSLESLVRKLTLDFRDVFARGMFFSSFRGDMALENGVVETENTRMNGSAGDLEVVGTTNLVDESLNYQLTYIPKVTSSLPVILAWMVNPPSGLAALLIDRVLHDAQVVSRLQYQITGSMSEPVVTEIRRDSREVELPDDISEEELEQLPQMLPDYEPVVVPRKNEGGQGND